LLTLLKVTLLFIAMLLAAQSTAVPVAQPGVIRVIVRDPQTSTPIGGVNVRLTGPRAPIISRTPAPPAPRTPSATRNAVTDAAGKAVFEGLEPGAYSMEAEADGYRGETPPSLPSLLAPRIASGYLEIRAESPDQGYVLYLVESGSLSGHVHASDGKPISNATITALVSGYRDGRRTFTEAAKTTTDSMGGFRLPSLGPGDYYLRYMRNPLSGGAIYYPGVPDIASAVSISIRSRENVDNLDIRVTEAPAFKISGRLMVNSRPPFFSDKSNRSAVYFAIAPAGAALADVLASPTVRSPMIDADGNFVIEGAPSGSWNLFASFPAADQPVSASRQASVRLASGHAHVNVVDRDVEHVVIVEDSMDVAGRVITEGTPERPRFGPLFELPRTPLRLSLLPQENIPGVGQVLNVTPDDSGNFAFTSVPAGKYNLSFLASMGFYLSDVRLGSKSIYDTATIEVPLDDRSERLEITLKAGGGEISGMLDDNLPIRPTEHYLEPRIALVPLALSQRQNILLYKTTTLTGPPGHFSFRDVPPGDYKVFAWESVPPLDAEKNPDFVATYEPFGVPVTVTLGQTSSVKVDLIPVGR
jgi:Carboxypeptidase regulatory-like domain